MFQRILRFIFFLIGVPVRLIPVGYLGPVMEIIARKLRAHREKNGGRLPRDEFEGAIKIAGVYHCTEILLKVMKGNTLVGYLLKLREKEDTGWQGLFHVPGVATRPLDHPLDISERLRQEAELCYHRDFPPNLVKMEFHREEERGGVLCVTTLLEVVIPYDIAEKLCCREKEGEKEKWRIVHPRELIDDKEVVENHRQYLPRLQIRSWYINNT